jgi:hypothetical protein
MGLVAVIISYYFRLYNMNKRRTREEYHLLLLHSLYRCEFENWNHVSKKVIEEYQLLMNFFGINHLIEEKEIYTSFKKYTFFKLCKSCKYRRHIPSYFIQGFWETTVNNSN